MINQSLNALRKCVDAVGKGRSIIPYRESVLTQLLTPSLNGSCKLLFILCISPNHDDLEETINTLNYGESLQHMNLLEREMALGQSADTSFELTEQLERTFGQSFSTRRFVAARSKSSAFVASAAPGVPPFAPSERVPPFPSHTNSTAQPFHKPGPKPFSKPAWAKPFSRPFQGSSVDIFHRSR